MNEDQQRELLATEQKIVNFEGAELLAFKANYGKIYVGVKAVCKGLGFVTEEQIRIQRRKIHNDIMLSKGGTNLSYLTPGGKQDALALDVEFLPIWLAKISITSKMQKENPELVDKLLKYQLKAKDVLLEAFLQRPKEPQTNLEIFEMAVKTEKERLRLQAEVEMLKPKGEVYDTLMTTRNSISMANMAKALGIPGFGRNKLFAFMREKKYFQTSGDKHNVPYQDYVNSGHFEVKEIIIQRISGPVSKFQTKVTPKGQDLIFRLVKEEGLLPTGEIMVISTNLQTTKEVSLH